MMGNSGVFGKGSNIWSRLWWASKIDKQRLERCGNILGESHINQDIQDFYDGSKKNVELSIIRDMALEASQVGGYQIPH